MIWYPCVNLAVDLISCPLLPKLNDGAPWRLSLAWLRLFPVTRTTRWWLQISGSPGWLWRRRSVTRRPRSPATRREPFGGSTGRSATLWWATPTGWPRRCSTVSRKCFLVLPRWLPVLLYQLLMKVRLALSSCLCVLCAPGKRYDEKVDIFSFGIVLCEVSLWVASAEVLWRCCDLFVHNIVMVEIVHLLSIDSTCFFVNLRSISTLKEMVNRKLHVHQLHAAGLNHV